MMRIALNGGMTVGALTSIRFTLAGLAMFVILRAKGSAIVRRGVIDGIWLGMLLVVIFWLQTDGLRLTTTAKSGFITGLYVLFTPLVAVAVGQRVKLASAAGALIASYGLYLLVHLPGGVLSGWNRGDLETLLCAILCGVHIVMMGHYTRRSEPWLLAGTQVLTTGVISLAVTAFLPSHRRFPEPWRGLVAGFGRRSDALYGPAFNRVRLLGPGCSADQARSDGVSRTVRIEPVLAAVLSVVWLKEPMTRTQAFGGALIVLAMIVAEALPYMFRAITVADTRP